MLRSRHIEITLLDMDREVLTTKGFPQGEVHLPLDGLLAVLSQSPYHAEGYADNILLAVQGRFITIMNYRLQQLTNWCRRENLRLNAFKTLVIPFTYKRKGLGTFRTLETMSSVLPSPVRQNIWE